MANVPPASVLGPEGPPPMKKLRTDSDSDMLSLFADLPEDLISADLRIGDSSLLNNSDSSNSLINCNSTTQQVSNTTPPQQQQQQQQNAQTSNAPQPIQQDTPVPNSTLNQRPPLSSPQPPSSISTSGDPTPTMPCVSSTPTHNVASSSGHSIQRTPLQMMPSSSVSPNQQQMVNHSVPNSHFTSSTGSPHPMGHMGGPQHMMPHMQQQRMRPGSHVGMTGPLRVGMPHQPMMNMSPHHGGMGRPGMGMSGMVPHQRMSGMGPMQMGGPSAPQYMHPSGHPAAMHGGHQMVNTGMPNQPPQIGEQNMMASHMMSGTPLHMRSNMMHQGGQSHMANMHSARFGMAGNPRPGMPGGGVPNNIMPDDSHLFGGGSMAGLPNMSQPRPQAMSNPAPSGMSGANPVRMPQPHNDIGGQGFGGGNPGPGGMNTAQQQSSQQQLPPAMNATGQTTSAGGTTSAMPGTPQQPISGPASNNSTTPSSQQSNPSTTPPVGATSAASGSALPGITPTLDAQPQTPQQQQPQHGSPSQVNPSPSSMNTPPTTSQPMQNPQTPQAMGASGSTSNAQTGGARVPTPPPPGGVGLNNPGGNSGGSPAFPGGFPPSGGKPQQQAPGGTSDPEKRKQIQQQLVLLLHAHKCQRREQEQSTVSGEYTPCSLPHCKTMKNVLNHMTVCQAGRNCQYPHCASSRQIITHWKNCNRSDCPVCLPLKGFPVKQTQQKRPGGADPLNPAARPMMPGMGGASSSGMGPAGPSGVQPGMMNRMGMNMGPGGPNFGMPNPSAHGAGYMNNPMMPPGGPMGGAGNQAMPPQGTGFPSSSGMPPSIAAQPSFALPIPHISSAPTQPWHDLVNPDLRQHLVRKLVEAIYPVHDPVALQDKRVYSLIQYAMKVEKAMFDTASNREDYYKLLAQKIYHIRKELEDRKKSKKGTQVNGDPSMPPASGAVANFFGPQSSPQQMGTAPPSVPQQGGSTTNYNLLPPTPFSNAPTSGASSASALTANSPLPQPASSEMSGNPPSISSPLDSKKDILQSKLLSPLSSGYQGPMDASSQNADPLLQGGGIPSLPSVKTIKEEPVTSVSQVNRSPRPPPSVEMATESSLPSLPPVELKKEVFRAKMPTPPSSGFQELPSTQTTDPMLQGSGVPSLPEPKSTQPPATINQKVVPDPTLLKVFTKEELCSALMPVFEMVWNQDPESIPFQQPVDPKALGIPDYFDIIKNPIDLSFIKIKLEEGDYKTGWEFCSDMYLMFDNAWSYNRKTSRVYRYCTKVAEVFEANIDDAMQKLGYCCGHRYTFHPQVLYCYGKPLCTIARDMGYYGYQNRYVYCQKCFGEILGDTITVGDDPLTATRIPKSQFKEMKNNAIDREGMVECVHCRRQMHSICALHLDSVWNKGFQCDNCLKALNIAKKENKFSAKRLPSTKLSAFLEDRVNKFIYSTNTQEAGKVTIRVVSSSDKVLETRMLMKERYSGGEFPEQFPYRSKAMFVFEEIDGVDVCFFGMHVQEYGSDCLAPNTRRVYISYLDSVHFFRPRSLRTSVYHEILIGYLDFCKRNGFMTAHIWACPPSEGDDYIFHCHPDEQKIPKPKRLTDWYRKMLDRGKSDNVVYEYRDIFKHCTEEGITSVTEIPYFEGDFWPNVIEETIKELDQEKQREASEKDIEGRAPKKADKRNKGSSKKGTGTRSKVHNKKGNPVVGGDDLSTKVYQTMEKHRDVFFTVLLNPPSSIASPLPGTTDPDNLITCDLMDGRDAFLTMARERHWEFSSLRRAKFSTMAMLYELHTQAGDRFVYNCNNCRMAVETRYHCRECDDFDLCQTCYKEVSHPHPMDKLGLGLELDTQARDDASIKDPKEQRKASIEKCIRFLVHATQCHNVHCKQPSCIKMKRVLTHTRDCKLMLSGKWNQCNVCKQFVLLCISHAKNCNVDKCPVPVCARIKKNLRDQRNQRRVQANRFMQQRVAQMNSAFNMTGNNTSAANAATPAATSQVGAPSPAPPNTSPGNPASINSPSTKPKGSPSTHPSNPASNKPYMTVPSPAAGPHSVGKGGPRTPTGKVSGMLAASSPAVPAHMSPAAKTAEPLPNTDGELIIRRVPGSSVPNDMMRRPAMAGPGQQMVVGPAGMNHMGNAMYGGHMGQGVTQGAGNPMMRVPGQQGFGNPHQQMMSMQMQQQQRQQRQYVGSAQQYSNPGMPGRMMGPGGSFPPSQHPQLEQILTASPQHHPQFNRAYMPGADGHHQYNQGYMGQVGGPHPSSLGPPPQYPVNRVQPAGYSQMGPGGPRPGMGGPGMQIGGNAGAGNYMYNANNNNSNYMGPGEGGFNSLPPQDKLSRFVEHL